MPTISESFQFDNKLNIIDIKEAAKNQKVKII